MADCIAFFSKLDAIFDQNLIYIFNLKKFKTQKQTKNTAVHLVLATYSTRNVANKGRFRDISDSCMFWYSDLMWDLQEQTIEAQKKGSSKSRKKQKKVSPPR